MNAIARDTHSPKGRTGDPLRPKGEFDMHPATHPEVARLVSWLHMSGDRVRFYFGCQTYGIACAEEHDTIGTVGRSTGKQAIPLLLRGPRSTGGGALLTNSIVAVQRMDGKFLYRHPLFHTGQWKVKRIKDDPEYQALVTHNGQVYSRHKTREEAVALADFMRGDKTHKRVPRKIQRHSYKKPPKDALFARYEPTTDFAVRNNAPESRKFDIQIYSDRKRRKKLARVMWFYRFKPTRAATTYWHNGATYPLVWLPRKPYRKPRKVTACS